MIKVRGTVTMPSGVGNRLNVTYDILDDEGKTISSLKRATLTVKDEAVLEAIKTIDTYVKNSLEGA